MSNERFTAEFKNEAVRQVIDRGYSVADLAARVGVSTHSLHKWAKAAKQDKTEEQTAELVEDKREIPIQSHHQEHAPLALCQFLGVAHSGFYEWLERSMSGRAVEDQRLHERICASHVASGGVFGSPRVFLNLYEIGEGCGKTA